MLGNLRRRAPTRDPQATMPAPMTTHDWNAILAEATAHLQRLIRIDTTNPPGNELVLAQQLARAFADAGIDHRLLEATPGRGAIVARIRGDGTARPVMLLAHMDVVGVEREGWSVDPFAAEVRDGYVYGRGAIDDKGMLTANLMVMLLLAREQAAGAPPLQRDVVFVATSDEETGGRWGLGWLAEQHPELLDAEFAINEGGRTRIVDGVPLYVAVQVAEKVANVVTVTARGPGGHAAIPLEGNAIGTLGRALARIAAHREPLCLLPATREFFRALGRVWPRADEAAQMRALVGDDAAAAERAAAALSTTPVFNAVLRTGISPTLVSGGIRHNVIPTEAAATLSVRTLPGQPLEEVLDRLRASIGESAVELTVVSQGADTPASDHESPMFRAIASAVADLDPTLATLPYLSTGATDSAILRRMGIQAYGLLPFPMTQDDEERMHGHDERIPLASLGFGIRLLHGAVGRVARETPPAS